MRRKTAGRVHHQRECAYCHGGIAEVRPVWLLGLKGGQIVGPYHAGCAAKLAAQIRRQGEANTVVGIGVKEYGRVPREETLPW